MSSWFHYAVVIVAASVVGCASAGKDDGGGNVDASISGFPDADPNRPDANGSLPDARPGAPDAASGSPDAAVVPPDAAGCTPTSVQYLLNSNFDSGAVNWIESGAGFPIVLSTTDATYPLPLTPHSGNFAAWLGGIDSATRHIRQDIAVPAGATNVELIGMRWIASEDSTIVVYDTYTATVRSTSGAILETVASLSNVNAAEAWIAWGGGLSGNYAGQTIRVQVESSQDSLLNTNFFTDTVVLRATVCL